MSIFDIIILAIALSIDACVVSFAHGLIIPENKFKNAFSLGSFTGIAQGLMPLIGYFAITPFEKFIEPMSKWLVFAIFLYLGLNFIKEAFEKENEVPLSLDLKSLFLIAIATSIDAMGAGINLALTKTAIAFPVILFTITTFGFAFFGYYCGCCLKKFDTKYLEIMGGVILILLAVKSVF